VSPPRRRPAGEEEQVVEEYARPGGLGAQPGQVLLTFLGRVGGGVLEEVRVAAYRHQGRTQLVRGVRDEPAQPLLGLGADGERVVDVLQHGVERGAQFLDLGSAAPAPGPHLQPRRAEPSR
jgi:hypothetical protein